MSRTFQSILLASLLSLAASCTVSPYSGQRVSSNQVPVEGMTDEPGVRVRVDAFDWRTNTFFSVAETTSETTPLFQAGQICPNSPALYRWKTTAPISWRVLWKKMPDGYHAKLRATELTAAETALKFTANPDGQSCMAQHAFNSTCDFYDVAYNICGYKLNEAIVVGPQQQPGL